MEELKQAKTITGLDIAKLTGTENEYKNLVFEIQERKNLAIVMDESEKNNEDII